MKKLVLLVALSLSGLSYGQAWENSGSNNSVYVGQDENNYPIYKNVRPFESLDSKIAITTLVSGIGAFITYIIVDRRKERKAQELEQEQHPLIQENVEI